VILGVKVIAGYSRGGTVRRLYLESKGYYSRGDYSMDALLIMVHLVEVIA
jgi:hypothetical protein